MKELRFISRNIVYKLNLESNIYITWKLGDSVHLRKVGMLLWERNCPNGEKLEIYEDTLGGQGR